MAWLHVTVSSDFRLMKLNSTAHLKQTNKQIIINFQTPYSQEKKENVLTVTRLDVMLILTQSGSLRKSIFQNVQLNGEVKLVD